MSTEPIQRRVVCAAMINRNGDIICSPRHWDMIARDQAELSGTNWTIAEQGFVDQFGKFMNREEAWEVAKAAGQIIRRVGGDGTRLFSENLY